jgi:hypothetical protein
MARGAAAAAAGVSCRCSGTGRGDTRCPFTCAAGLFRHNGVKSAFCRLVSFTRVPEVALNIMRFLCRKSSHSRVTPYIHTIFIKSRVRGRVESVISEALFL